MQRARQARREHANGYEKALHQTAGAGERQHTQTRLDGVPIAMVKTISSPAVAAACRIRANPHAGARSQRPKSLNQSRGIDYVFGIDIPCLAERGQSIDLSEALPKLRDKIVGSNGVFVYRCFNDLVSSMKHADDTGFYCYRAIESLRHHCAALHGLSTDEKAKQWEKFREVSGCDEQTLRTIKAAADPLRHGEASGMTSDERTKLFTMTWEVVDGYFNSVQPNHVNAAPARRA